MSAILYGTIHDRANNSYAGPKLTAENYELWVAHWFVAAGDLAEEFDKAGLPATANAFRKIIIEQNQLLGKSK